MPISKFLFFYFFLDQIYSFRMRIKAHISQNHFDIKGNKDTDQKAVFKW